MTNDGLAETWRKLWAGIRADRAQQVRSLVLLAALIPLVVTLLVSFIWVCGLLWLLLFSLPLWFVMAAGIPFYAVVIRRVPRCDRVRMTLVFLGLVASNAIFVRVMTHLFGTSWWCAGVSGAVCFAIGFFLSVSDGRSDGR